MTAAIDGGAYPARSRRSAIAGAAWRPPSARPAYALYTRRLRREVQAAAAPRHLAVILDGNRRWAAGEGLRDAGAGHRRGADKIDELLDWCAPLGIEEITAVGALERESRAPRIAADGALRRRLRQARCARAARAAGGHRDAHARDRALRGSARARLGDDPPVEQSTAQQPGPSLTIALGYSGRDELIDACKTLVLSLAEAGVPAARIAEEITRESLAARLYTAGVPDPDLIIRTSGEQRLSGFLPWQSAHSELYFTDVYWPAFRELDLLRALRTYQQRVRRHGL